MAETQQSNIEAPDNEKGKPKPERSMGRLVIFGILLAIGLVWGGMKLIRSLSYEETDDAQIAGNIYPVIPRVPGKVVEVLANDNQMVKKGDVLIRLDPSDYQIKRDMAEAQLLKARAAVSGAKADIIAAAAAQIKLAADLRRSQNLQKQDVISRAELDAATAGATAASAQHAAAGDNYKAALAQAKLAEAELKNAELQLSWTTITAPADGKVSKKNVQPGQYVTPGQQLIAIVGSGDLWVVANFKETQLEHMRPGQKVIIKVDAFPGKELKGHIDSISAGTGAEFALLPPDNASGNFVKVTQRVPVKIVFDEKTDLPLAAGMNVIAEVKVK
ncbi:MAG TPA: HlyD family secretion protein [Chlorobaculum sp.]|jgi:membrane fusion protein (multidrug efflux system)|uniref:Multidrug resistance protein A n=1 Tax=Chlorobaculum tepidum (strain ATCC 49652 / DSM 12025 / NBRC 103806 / TLS) TaxID=194439 RepID=Q8KG63_CHLTE|nr:HlyD family secretion protein [Chlorobaculum tepidum]AAM71353.1 multidrug resistance protein A [Chlorobaculum tepidum TLS]HBU24363.1 HlyD family secretion protein [Chlorobaculum sp.]